MRSSDESSRRRQLRNEYGSLYLAIADILYRHDPIGLVALGAPADEYQPEADTILPKLKQAGSVEELRRIIHQEFISWFGPDSAGPEERYQALSLDVWRVWHQNGVSWQA